MSKKNICGIITLYNPPASYLDNINTYINYLDILYLVDNTPIINHKDHDSLLRRFPEIEILSFGKNIGIAAALNLGIKEGLKNNYSWLLTMDQDSSFDEDQAKRYFSSLPFIDSSCVAVLSPSHKVVSCGDDAVVYEKRNEVMTSGNLLNLLLIRHIGFFNEDLFIDSVDHDYCLRANLLGLEVLQAKNCFIQHVVGDLCQGSFLFGLKKKTFHIHSPKRMYFIVRNSRYINKRYGKVFRESAKTLNKANYRRISRCLRYSNRRRAYIKYILKAYLDYYAKKYGNRVGL